MTPSVVPGNNDARAAAPADRAMFLRLHAVTRTHLKGSHMDSDRPRDPAVAPRRRRARGAVRRRAMRSGWVAPAGPDLAAFEHEVAERVGVPHAVGLVLRHGRAAPGPGLLGRRPGRRRPGVDVDLRRHRQRHPLRRRRAALRRLRPVTGNINPALLARGPRRPAPAGSAGPGGHPGRPVRQVRRLRRRSPTVARVASRCSATPPSRSAPRYQGRPAGSFGDAAVLSFNGNKIMTTSGGGMLLTDDATWPRTCASCRPRPGSRCRTTSTPRSATTTGCPTSSPRSAAPSWPGSTR